MNYGVIQGFPALRKAITTHVKEYDIFHVCWISPISCWHVTRLSRHSVRLMNERRSLHHSQSKIVCRIFFGLWQLKHWKIRIAYRQWRSNFPRRGRKPKYGKKNQRLCIVALVMTFLAAENKYRPLEHFSQANFGHEPERFLLSVRTKSVTKNFVHWKLRPLFVFVVQYYNASRFFILSQLIFNALCNFYSKIVDPFTFGH